MRLISETSTQRTRGPRACLFWPTGTPRQLQPAVSDGEADQLQGWVFLQKLRAVQGTAMACGIQPSRAACYGKTTGSWGGGEVPSRVAPARPPARTGRHNRGLPGASAVSPVQTPAMPTACSRPARCETKTHRSVHRAAVDRRLERALGESVHLACSSFAAMSSRKSFTVKPSAHDRSPPRRTDRGAARVNVRLVGQRRRAARCQASIVPVAVSAPTEFVDTVVFGTPSRRFHRARRRAPPRPRTAPRRCRSGF